MLSACPCCNLVPCLLQEQINITLDHRCRIFQNLDGALGEQPPWGGESERGGSKEMRIPGRA